MGKILSICLLFRILDIYWPIWYDHPRFIFLSPSHQVDLLKYPPHKRPQFTFNDYDKVFEVDRRSHDGDYHVEEGIPVNPRGRTGLKGRGRLGRWGPNAAGAAIVTRWKRDPTTQRFVSVQNLCLFIPSIATFEFSSNHHLESISKLESSRYVHSSVFQYFLLIFHL